MNPAMISLLRQWSQFGLYCQLHLPCISQQTTVYLAAL